MSRQDPLIDPESPGRMRPPDRVVYAEGVLLDARDFTAEQTYHRSRLARLSAHLCDSGTVAGLRVEWQRRLEPGEDAGYPGGREERLRVSPGLAVDRLGRLIELRRDLCLRLESWYADRDPGALRTSLLNPPASEITADVFVRFASCERGKTPAFAGTTFDAAGAAVPSRLRDGGEVELVLRQEDAPGGPPLPVDPRGAIDPDAPAGDRLAALREAILDAWREGTDFTDSQGLLPAPEHAPGQDTTSVFLARLALGASDAGPEARPERKAADVTVYNHSRRFVYPPGALARWLGIGS